MRGRISRRATVLAAVTTVGAVGAAGAAAHATAPAATTVKVVEKEFTLKPTPTSVKAGSVTFSVRNAGKIAHELVVIKTTRAPGKLRMKGTKASETGRVARIGAIKAGKTRRLTVTLKRGKFVLLCNLAGHYKAGQFAAFRVT